MSSSEVDALGARWRTAWVGAGEGFEACCTPDVGYEDPLTPEPLEGVSALAAHARRLHDGFPDLRVEASGRNLAGGGLACLPWRALGTQKGALGVLPASGRFVVLQGLHYVELDNGLVRRARGFFDLYDAAVQLGLLPRRGSLTEAALLLLRGYGLRPGA